MIELETNIHPNFKTMKREAKEGLLGQRGRVIWLFGLSGCGKSTLAIGLEKRLHDEGILTQILDGDNLRSSLNCDLGFSDSDRRENIRRVAEIAKLLLHIGIIIIVSCITPKRSFRHLARQIIGEKDYIEVFVSCPFEVCKRRDVKGLYAKSEAGKIMNFTGKDAEFEEPLPNFPADLILKTQDALPDQSIEKLFTFVFPKVRRTQNA